MTHPAAFSVQVLLSLFVFPVPTEMDPTPLRSVDALRIAMGRLDALEDAQHIPQKHIPQVPGGITSLQNHVMERRLESISIIDDIHSLLWHVFWRMRSPEEKRKLPEMLVSVPGMRQRFLREAGILPDDDPTLWDVNQLWPIIDDSALAVFKRQSDDQ